MPRLGGPTSPTLATAGYAKDMVTTEQSERLLGQVVSGVGLDTATAALGIPDLELLAKLQTDEAFQASLYLAMQVGARYTRVVLSSVGGQ